MEDIPQPGRMPDEGAERAGPRLSTPRELEDLRYLRAWFDDPAEGSKGIVASPGGTPFHAPHEGEMSLERAVSPEEPVPGMPSQDHSSGQPAPGQAEYGQAATRPPLVLPPIQNLPAIQKGPWYSRLKNNAEVVLLSIGEVIGRIRAPQLDPGSGGPGAARDPTILHGAKPEAQLLREREWEGYSRGPGRTREFLRKHWGPVTLGAVAGLFGITLAWLECATRGYERGLAWEPLASRASSAARAPTANPALPLAVRAARTPRQGNPLLEVIVTKEDAKEGFSGIVANYLRLTERHVTRAILYGRDGRSGLVQLYARRIHEENREILQDADSADPKLIIHPGERLAFDESTLDADISAVKAGNYHASIDEVMEKYYPDGSADQGFSPDNFHDTMDLLGWKVLYGGAKARELAKDYAVTALDIQKAAYARAQHDGVVVKFNRKLLGFDVDSYWAYHRAAGVRVKDLAERFEKDYGMRVSASTVYRRTSRFT